MTERTEIVMSKRIFVIGAGPGGLAAAMLLARSGLRVTIFERSSNVGGRTSTVRSNGFSFDLGPTFFLYPRVLEEIFRTVGRDLREEVELVRLDPQYRLIFGGGGELLATPDVERMERAIAALSPNDAASFRAFLDDNRLKLANFRRCLESPFRGWRDVLRWPMLRLLPLLRPWLSLDRELARYFRDPRIRLAFSFQSKYLGMSPFNCPSLFSILSFLEYEHGVHHPIGGCGAVTEAMARVVRELGGEIRLDEPVEEILFEGKRAVGVRTSEGGYKADAVIGSPRTHSIATAWKAGRFPAKPLRLSTSLFRQPKRSEIVLPSPEPGHLLIPPRPCLRVDLHDGITLPRAFRAAGFRTDLCDITEIATCRMYRSAAAVWRGLAKNATEGLASPGMILPATTILLGGQVFPLLLLATAGWLPPLAACLALLAAVASYYPRFAAAKRFRQSWLGAFLHPAGILIFVAIQWHALLRNAIGQPAAWKGREYQVLSVQRR